MRRKVLTILMALTLLFSMTTLSVMAAEKTQDGILVTQTTDMSEYESGDNITATLKLTNSNEVAISNVHLSNKAPKGFHTVSNGTKHKTCDAIDAGESVTLTTTFAPDKVSDGPETGDSGNGLLFYSIICLACVFAIALILRSKKVHKSRLMILLFCLVVGTSTMTFGDDVFAATSQPNSMKLTTTVAVNGVKLDVDSIVSYEIVVTPTPVEEYTVTFDMRGHGIQIDPLTNVASGSKILEPIAPAGDEFEGWFKEASCTNKWNFNIDTITGDTTLYAKWATTVEEDKEYTTEYFVAMYINIYKHLPPNYYTKSRAKSELGYTSGNPKILLGGNVCIGGSIFKNREGLLPALPDGEVYRECDVDYDDAYNTRGINRLIYTAVGKVYSTKDHYESFKELY